MVQFNLLPDVKLEFIKARRVKRLMTLASVVVIAVSLTVLVVMLLTVDVFQKKTLSDLNKDIATYSTKLKSTKDIDKILTVQNQLNTLGSLHAQKAVGSRLFTYLSQLTPASTSLTKLDVDFTQNTMSITGVSSQGLSAVNTLTDTLKATKYTTGKDSTPVKAFSDVVLATFARDDKSATYTITLSFDKTIFDSANDVTLNVPTGATADPSSLFVTTGGTN